MYDFHRIQWNLQPLKYNGQRGFTLPPLALFRFIPSLSQLHDILDKALHAGSAVLFHALREMAVSIQRKGSCGVAQIALDGLYIIPRPDGVYCIGMAQIMQAHALQASGSNERLKALINVLLAKRSARAARKHKAIGIVPQWSRSELCLKLAAALGLELQHDGWGRGERPGLATLGRDK